MSGVAKLEKWQVIGFDPCQAATDALHERCGLRACDDEIEVTQQADVILIAVKPQHVQGVVEKIAPHLDGKILVLWPPAYPCGASKRTAAIPAQRWSSCPTRRLWSEKAVARYAWMIRP
ncbi:MAG: pyrroline-5-carboxylate reductase family protein [Bilophila wadsworthia]